MSAEDYIGLLGFAVAGLAVLLLLVYLKLRAMFRRLHARLLASECELGRLECELLRLKATSDGVRGLGRN